LPYNSSSFERQLAKHKQAQAAKAVAAIPRKIHEDPHKVQSHISAERGSIKSYAKDPLQLMGEGAQTTPVITQRDEVIIPIIIQRSHKPWYKRTWFVLLVITTLPMLFAPILYKEEMTQLKDTASMVKTTTGVDPFALKTYTNMMRGKAAEPETPQQPAAVITEATPANVTPSDKVDMKQAVQGAQEKAESVTSKGASYSMQYIEEETKRLNEAAKQFDKEFKK